jgi:mannosyltransferase
MILLSLFLDVLLHQFCYHVSRPSEDLDAVFQGGCAEPDTHVSRENAAIVMLTRNGNIETALTSLQLLEGQFNRRFPYPIVLHEQ